MLTTISAGAALEHVTVKIAPGETVAIIGTAASGGDQAGRGAGARRLAGRRQGDGGRRRPASACLRP
jgi:predicted ABC-type transport system involved in lysophospholipase L1 biosynthesis ATPase subunit